MWVLIKFIIIFIAFIDPMTAQMYPLGKEFTYSFENKLMLNDLAGTDIPVQYKITGTLLVSTLWEENDRKLLSFNLMSPKITVINKTIDLFKTSYQSKFYADWKGKITTVFLNPRDDLSIRNLKKGIISLFQYLPLEGESVEDDVSGNCDVIYEIQDKTKFRKIKGKCRTNDVKFHKRSEEPLNVSVKASRVTDYKIEKKGNIEKLENREFFRITLAGNQNIGSRVENVMKLTLISKRNDAEITTARSFTDAVNTLGKSVESDNLMTTEENYCRNEQCLSIIKLVKELKADLADDKIGKEEAAMATLKIILSAKDSKVEDLVRVLNAKTTQHIKGQLFDLLGAMQSLEAHEAAKKVLDFKNENDFNFVEKYLQALAVGTRPKEVVIKDLLTMLEEDVDNEKLKSTLIQTVTSMARHFTNLPGQSFKSDIVVRLQTYLDFSIFSCTSDECRIVYLNGFINLQSPSAISSLTALAATGSRSISVTAIKALKTFPVDFFSVKDKKLFEDIFYQKSKKFDSSARTMALDILLKFKPNKEELKNLIDFLKSNDKAFEVKQYLLQRIRMISEECEQFRKSVEDIIKNDKQLNNYHIIGTRGLSTALSRKFLNYPSFNSTLLSIQEINNGVLKRGIVDMIFEAGNQKFSYFTLGLYAGGLSSFVGGSSDDTEKDEETATAGMEITVQGSYLRPLEFFNGQGQLMGHVWSGTASEPTPAYQATTLLHDHKEFIHLQNGVVVAVDVLGAMSIDLNGQVTFSLWNRNAKSKVEQNTGLAIIGRTSVDTSFAFLQTEFVVKQEPKLYLVSNIEFSGDIMLCIHLSQPDIILKLSFTKTAMLPETKHSLKYKKNISYKLPGNTHALNQKNNEMCNKIYNK